MQADDPLSRKARGSQEGSISSCLQRALITLALLLAVTLPLSGVLSADNFWFFPIPEGCQVSLQFPRKVLRWCDLISQHAGQAHLSPDLVAAVILQESGGNPQAISHSGAVGLMQVMPRDGTAADFMCPKGPCFADRPTSQDLRDPAYNIAYGTQLLKRLINNSQGDLREALKAYGPMDVGYRYADNVLELYQRYRRE